MTAPIRLRNNQARGLRWGENISHLQVDLRRQFGWIIENVADKDAHLLFLERKILHYTSLRKLLGHDTPLFSPVLAIRQKNKLIVKSATVIWIISGLLHMQKAYAQISHFLSKDENKIESRSC